MSTHQHDRQHPHHQSHGNGAPASGSRKPLIVIVGVIMMIVALVAYVMSVDESLAPDEQGQEMPAAE